MTSISPFASSLIPQLLSVLTFLPSYHDYCKSLLFFPHTTTTISPYSSSLIPQLLSVLTFLPLYHNYYQSLLFSPHSTNTISPYSPPLIPQLLSVLTLLPLYHNYYQSLPARLKFKIVPSHFKKSIRSFPSFKYLFSKSFLTNLFYFYCNNIMPFARLNSMIPPILTPPCLNLTVFKSFFTLPLDQFAGSRSVHSSISFSVCEFVSL